MDLTSLDARHLRQERQQIGMIFQSFNLLMQRTALQNVCFPLELVGTPKSGRESGPMELLDIVGLSRPGRFLPHTAFGRPEAKGGHRQGACLKPQGAAV